MMTLQTLMLKKGPAGDILILLKGNEIFATAQHSYLLQSPQSLNETGAAVVLDPSYWWFDAGKEPESLRIERRGSRIEFVGKKRLEQTHGDSAIILGQCDYADWVKELETI
jgi:hypothetical protein